MESDARKGAVSFALYLHVSNSQGDELDGCLSTYWTQGGEGLRTGHMYSQVLLRESQINTRYTTIQQQKNPGTLANLANAGGFKVPCHPSTVSNLWEGSSLDKVLFLGPVDLLGELQ